MLGKYSIKFSLLYIFGFLSSMHFCSAKYIQLFKLQLLLARLPALKAILRDEAQQMMYEGKTISPDGVTVTGELYITPKVSATKQVLQSLLRIIVRPFRYVL